MKILVIGSGGREHALLWKLAKSPKKPTLMVAPGNPGMAQLAQCLAIDPLDIEGLLIHAKREGVDLTIVGPEAPLAAGLVDRFEAEGLRVFGPSKAAAQLEASKHFAKKMMQEAGIPTAGYAFCQTEPEALTALKDFSAPYVIKEDGLAAGKGVTVTSSLDEAKTAIEQAFSKGMSVVIEAFLEGEELSLLAVCDGQRAIPLVSAQDFKRVGECNTGPNTGGMGAYAPVPWATPALLQQVQQQVFSPLMAAMFERGTPYKGILYAGLMISPLGKVQVVEFNCRFGDPETQVVLPLLNTDLIDLLKASAEGNLSDYEGVNLYDEGQSAVTVVMASQGYPGAYATGKPITLPPILPEGVTVFHAGTTQTPAQPLVTAGGRVLNVTTRAASLNEARTLSYQAIEGITFEGAFCRKDIALEASKKQSPATV